MQTETRISSRTASLTGIPDLETDIPTEGKELSGLSIPRKNILCLFLCFTNFVDTFANSSLLSAIPPISNQLGISNANAVWLFSGYQLTFAALLLGSGRLSDLYNPKYVFLSGAGALSISSLAAGFVRSQVPLIILRALMGVGAALTVPSALFIIVHVYPDPEPQAMAISLFGGFGAVGNVMGLLIGAFIVNWGTWPWIFYTFAIVGAVLFIIVFALCPSPRQAHASILDKARRFKRLDIFGVLILTVGLILFVFGVTSGSVNGWNSARCLAPFIISLFIIAGFFVWEARIPEDMAAIPPSLWRVTNFPVLAASALLPWTYWVEIQLLFSWVWQNVYGWSPVITALHFLPLGLLAFPVFVITSLLQRRFPLKWVIFAGLFICLSGTALLPFGDSPQHYWRFVFPGFCLGTTGMTIYFATVNIAIFAVTPPEKAGVVGSILNCFLQLGCAAGSAIATSIQTSVDQSHGGDTSWAGRRAAFWFIFAMVAVQALCVLVFMHNIAPIESMPPPIVIEGKDKEKNRVDSPDPRD